MKAYFYIYFMLSINTLFSDHDAENYQFNNLLEKCHKKISSSSEFNFRKWIFKRHNDEINSFNSKHTGIRKGLNKFSYMTDQER